MTSHPVDYDIIVVGAGPAGLAAARTAARLGFRTVVIERAGGPGELSHPCTSVVAPLAGVFSGRRALGGLFFPRLDLLIPERLIVGYPATQRFVSPAGFRFETGPAVLDQNPVAAIDKRGLLQMLAAQGSAHGLAWRFNTPVTGLLREGNSVVGIRSGALELRSRLVISAEGASRSLTRAAGLWDPAPPAHRYAFVAMQELDAPYVDQGAVGQWVTFGQRYTTAPKAYGTVVAAAPGKATVQFTLLADRLDQHTLQSARHYLHEYMVTDPRVRFLFRDARTVHASAYRMTLRDAPRNAVRSGFMGVGDSMAPGGYLGILPSIFMGRQAALIAAGALDAGGATSRRLAAFNYLTRGPVFQSLQSEAQMVAALTEVTDRQLDRLCQILDGTHPIVAAGGAWRSLPFAGLNWLLSQPALMQDDWLLLEQLAPALGIHGFALGASAPTGVSSSLLLR